ncbi:MAG: hypothetical protein JWR19_124 [Pedosphaera sp.]|nr:hypothetical protein [Pedosphaera sp.]
MQSVAAYRKVFLKLNSRQKRPRSKITHYARISHMQHSMLRMMVLYAWLAYDLPFTRTATRYFRTA